VTIKKKRKASAIRGGPREVKITRIKMQGKERSFKPPPQKKNGHGQSKKRGDSRGRQMFPRSGGIGHRPHPHKKKTGGGAKPAGKTRNKKSCDLGSNKGASTDFRWEWPHAGGDRLVCNKSSGLNKRQNIKQSYIAKISLQSQDPPVNGRPGISETEFNGGVSKGLGQRG